MGLTLPSEVFKKIEDFFQNEVDFGLVGIYGSYARGKNRPESDIDICVAKSRPLPAHERIRLSTGLSLKLGKEVDLLDLQAAGGVIRAEVLQTALWIKKDPTFFASFLSRFLIDQADFQPYHERMVREKQRRFLKK